MRSGRRDLAARRLLGATDGVAVVEFAVIAPVFLLFVFGIVEFGRAYWTWNTMRLAVEEGGRYAMLWNGCYYGSTCPSGCTPSGFNSCVSTYALTQLPGLTASITVTATSAAATATYPATMTVKATYTFDFLVPTLLPYGPIDLTTTSVVPLV
jgi:Flp pilus assembly protein TadG